MEIVEGGFTTAETEAAPGTAEHAAHEREAAYYASRITTQTYQDIDQYASELLMIGYYYDGEMQGFVDGNGRWRPIDFQAVEKLPADPAKRKEAEEFQKKMVEALKQE